MSTLAACNICGRKDDLIYIYPLLGNPYLGLKVCREHEKLHEESPKEFEKLLKEAQCGGKMLVR